MPHLPLNDPEPFSATLGIMLYPGTDDQDRRNARAFTAQYLAKPMQIAARDEIVLEEQFLLKIATRSGERLLDLDDRWYWGTAVGEMFKVFFALANTRPKYASWHRAADITTRTAKASGFAGSKRSLDDALDRFGPVAHLWAAWSIRGGNFSQAPEVNYDYVDDFFSFVTEAETLRHWAEKWSPTRPRARPPLPDDIWCASPEWRPPDRHQDWPRTGVIPKLELPLEVIDKINLPGRPKKSLK